MSPITNLLHRPNEYRGVQNETESSSTASTIRRPLVSALKKGSETTKKRKYLQRKVLFVEKSISWPPDGCGTVPVEVGRSGTNLGQERLVESDPEKMVSAQDYYRQQFRNQWHKPSRSHTTKVSFVRGTQSPFPNFILWLVFISICLTKSILVRWPTIYRPFLPVLVVLVRIFIK